MKIELYTNVFWDAYSKNVYKKCFSPTFGPVDDTSASIHIPPPKRVKIFLLQKLKLNMSSYIFWDGETKNEY